MQAIIFILDGHTENSTAVQQVCLRFSLLGAQKVGRIDLADGSFGITLEQSGYLGNMGERTDSLVGLHGGRLLSESVWR